MANEWYPLNIDSLPEWHVNFASRAAFDGILLGLTAAQISQAGADATTVTNCINVSEAADSYKRGITQWRDAFLRGTDETQPIPPPQPAEVVVAPLAKGAIKKRTLAYVGIIKASPAYTPTIGEMYNIVGSGGIPLITPTVVGTAQPFSVAKLAIKKGGYEVLAIDMKRGTGDWEQVGISMRATFTHTIAPLVAGQPEVREYRIQGMKDNARVGDLSLHTTVVTTP